MIDPRKEFIAQLRRYQMGSISRRHFLGVTGLGTAMAVMAGAVPGLLPRKAYRRQYRRQGRARHLAELSRPEGFRDVQGADRRRGRSQRVRLERGVAGQAAGRRHRLGRLRAHQLHRLDLCRRSASSSRWILRKIPNYDIASHDAAADRAKAPSKGTVYGAAKDWGTTGFAVNTPR